MCIIKLAFFCATSWTEAFHRLAFLVWSPGETMGKAQAHTGAFGIYRWQWAREAARIPLGSLVLGTAPVFARKMRSRGVCGSRDEPEAVWMLCHQLLASPRWSLFILVGKVLHRRQT